ncbi:MAG: hypothetical protein QM831_05980 [Kofleriaceae bacterium]
MTRPTPEWVAKKRVVFVYPDGHRAAGHIAIGKPYTLGDGVDEGLNYEAHCPVEITGIHKSSHPPIGAGTLSALLHAVHLVEFHLRGFIEQGGRILDADGESDIEVDTLFG